MTRPDIDRLLLRVVEADTRADAEVALRELVAIDAADESAAEEHPPIGDLYSQLAHEAFEDEDNEEAVRLQSTALEHPCTNRRHEQGTLLGYRFVGLEDASALDELKGSRSGGRSDASLLSGFAAQAELVELAMALRLHDEALEIAKAARPPDYDLLRDVVIGRALARADADLPQDEDDLSAEEHLDAIGREAALLDAREARQLVVLRDQLDAARAAWPDLIELADPDAYYKTLERRWQERTAETGHAQPYPVDVALFAGAGVRPTRLLDDLPGDLVLAVEASGIGPIAWPPGRNDECWCGSGRKYKRCCG